MTPPDREASVPGVPGCRRMSRSEIAAAPTSGGRSTSRDMPPIDPPTIYQPPAATGSSNNSAFNDIVRSRLLDRARARGLRRGCGSRVTATILPGIAQDLAPRICPRPIYDRRSSARHEVGSDRAMAGERFMMRNLSRRHFIAGAIASGGLSGLAAGAAGRATSSTLFRDVILVDGTGAAPRSANVLVVGDRIARVTRPLRGERVAGAEIVEGAGRVLTPGFIDLHTHGNPLRSGYESYLAMGVTTITLGQDGSGPGPDTGPLSDTNAWRRAVEQ